MAKYFDENGNEVTAFSQEELEAKKKEALAEHLKNNPVDAEKAKTLQADLDAANKKIKDFEAAGGSEGQKKRLIEERDAANAKLDETLKGFATQMSEFKEAIFGGAKKKVLDKLAGSDPELRKKIEFEYDQFKGDTKNEVEITERLKKAYTLATGNAPKPDFMDNMGGAGTRGEGSGANKVQTTETDNGKAMRKVFGISDADAEKFKPEAK